jgi:hypothetical protein
MNEEDFKRLCPNLWAAIQARQKMYDVYGIPYVTHSYIQYWELIQRVEDSRAFIYYQIPPFRDMIKIILN